MFQIEIARADVDAAAPEAAHVLRSRRRGQPRAARARSRAAWSIRICAGEAAKSRSTYPHPCLEPVLSKTLGVPLFQEQVMKLAVVAADYTPGEADQLRRDMAAWRRSGRIEQHRERLISRDAGEGHRARVRASASSSRSAASANTDFQRVTPPRFALISYASSYLRRHYPAEFTCALLNAQPMGFYSIATIVEDAKRQGLDVRPVDAQRSAWDCTLEDVERPAPCRCGSVDSSHDRRFAVRMGLRFVKGFGEKDGEQVSRCAHDRTVCVARGCGASNRVGSAGAQCAGRSGCVREPRSVATICAVGGARRRERDAHDADVFDAPSPPDVVPGPAFLPLDAGETITWDYRASSHSVRGHPMAALRPLFQCQGLPDANTVQAMSSGTRVHYAGLVICRQRPATASGVTFMTLEDETGFVNLVVWDRCSPSTFSPARTDVTARRDRDASQVAGGRRPPDRRAAVGARASRPVPRIDREPRLPLRERDILRIRILPRAVPPVGVTSLS